MLSQHPAQRPSITRSAATSSRFEQGSDGLHAPRLPLGPPARRLECRCYRASGERRRPGRICVCSAAHDGCDDRAGITDEARRRLIRCGARADALSLMSKSPESRFGGEPRDRGGIFVSYRRREEATGNAAPRQPRESPVNRSDHRAQSIPAHTGKRDAACANRYPKKEER